ncbi:uncharacterized protein IL334_005648 [Kwoniella shivajii]|uniref:WSC domain-containing protein n=1 Tax=Kwoniella shivajii TaxID=564305 RepID=A0ABZ1D593_9TREE|nr:hypothetical protein IL334_005648 [Kwoniella shivajii]
MINLINRFTFFLTAALALITFVKCDNLFIGCGDEIDFVEMTFTTPFKNVCYTMCKNYSYTYYTHKADLGQCVCYIYPPPAAEYVPGAPDACEGQMQYNLIKSNWEFLKCYHPKDMSETPSDSFKACMDGCAPHEVAIAKPTGIFPGQTNCICASEHDLNGLEEGKCDFKMYYAYKHTPTPVPTFKRALRALAVAQRQAFRPRGPY